MTIDRSDDPTLPWQVEAGPAMTRYMRPCLRLGGSSPKLGYVAVGETSAFDLFPNRVGPKSTTR
jgi:hypothetical protein